MAPYTVNKDKAVAIAVGALVCIAYVDLLVGMNTVQTNRELKSAAASLRAMSSIEQAKASAEYLVRIENEQMTKRKCRRCRRGQQR